MSDPTLAMKLPRLVDPRKLANQGTELQGLVPGDQLPRLSKAVLETGDIEASLEFSRDTMRRALIDGNFVLNVTMTCQRCLQPVSERIDGEIHVGVVWDELRAAELPKSIDPWLVSTESGDLYELLEDEFLLSLPIIPFHDENACAGSGQFSTGEHEEKRDNPFDVLAKLKK